MLESSSVPETIRAHEKRNPIHIGFLFAFFADSVLGNRPIIIDSIPETANALTCFRDVSVR